MKCKILPVVFLILVGMGSSVLIFGEGVSKGEKTGMAAATQKPVEPSSNQEIRATLQILNRIFTEKVILGDPLEVKDLILVPVATVSLGFGSGSAPDTKGLSRGAMGGGMATPAGVIVISKRGVQMLPIKQSSIGEIMGAVMPVLFQALRNRQVELAPTAEDIGDTANLQRQVVTYLFQLLLQNGFRFGLFPWPLGLIVVFLIGWLGLTLFVGTFMPDRVAVTARQLSRDTWRSGLAGLLAAVLVFIVAAALLVSVVGIPLMLILLLSAGAIWLLGMVSMTYVVGKRVARQLKRRPLSPVSTLLSGAVVLGAVRIVPIIGWIVWLILGLIGFGAVVMTKFGASKTLTGTL